MWRKMVRTFVISIFCGNRNTLQVFRCRFIVVSLWLDTQWGRKCQRVLTINHRISNSNFIFNHVVAFTFVIYCRCCKSKCNFSTFLRCTTLLPTTLHTTTIRIIMYASFFNQIIFHSKHLIASTNICCEAVETENELIGIAESLNLGNIDRPFQKPTEEDMNRKFLALMIGIVHQPITSQTNSECDQLAARCDFFFQCKCFINNQNWDSCLILQKNSRFFISSSEAIPKRYTSTRHQKFSSQRSIWFLWSAGESSKKFQAKSNEFCGRIQFERSSRLFCVYYENSRSNCYDARRHTDGQISWKTIENIFENVHDCGRTWNERRKCAIQKYGRLFFGAIDANWWSCRTGGCIDRTHQNYSR